METEANIQLINLGDLERPMLEHVGARRWQLLQSRPVRAMLRRRFLMGTLERNETAEDSIANVLALASSDTPDQGFIICNNNPNGLLGFASVQPEVELRQQRLPLPTRITRKLSTNMPNLSRPVDYLVEGRSNVSAWADPSMNPEQHMAVLRHTYRELSRLAGRGVWTLEPIRSYLSGRDASVLCEAGYTALCNSRRFDDGEATGLAMAPISSLYIAGTPRMTPTVVM